MKKNQRNSLWFLFFLLALSLASPVSAQVVSGTSLITSGQAGVVLDPFGTAAGNTGEARFKELVANGVNYIGFKSADLLSANVVWTLPSVDGTSGQVLQTDGAGLLSWVTGGGGGGAPTGATYTVMSLDATLSAERVLSAGTGITLTDGGANGNATLAVNQAFAPTWTGAHIFSLNDALNASVTDLMTLTHSTTGVAAANIGTGLLFRAEDSIGNTDDAVRLSGILTTATSGSEASSFTISTRTGGGALTEKVRVDNVGNVGIGRTDSANLLAVSGSSTGSRGIFIDNTNTAGYGVFRINSGNADAAVGMAIHYFGSTWTDSGGARRPSQTTVEGFEINGIAIAAPNVNGIINFFAGGVASSNEAMRITSSRNIHIGTTAGNANAILDVTSTTKAFMPPRMTTTQRDAISSPTAGMQIFNITTNKLNIYTTIWEAVTSG